MDVTPRDVTSLRAGAVTTRGRQAAIVVGAVAVATLVRLMLHPVLAERGVFLIAIIAVALVAHVAGLWAGVATMVSSIVIAAALFLPSSGFAGLGGPSGWLQVVLSTLLSLFLVVLGGRFHGLVRELKASLQRERKLLESERAARAAAERANRTRDEFLAVLSHELRSPLNAIVGWSHLLKGAWPSPEAARGLETILRNADHQVRLLSDIADLSRVATGKLVLDAALVDVRAALDQAVDAVRLAADARGVRIQLLIPETPLIVQGELDRLRQVFWNLLSNAIKFTPRGGSVQVGAERRGDSVVVEVVDTGQGIALEFLPHVFDTFRQENATRARRHGGLGLGLSIVRHLVEAHGGTVRADSDGPEKGTTLTVTLPASGGTLSGPAPLDIGRPYLAGARVLVVDDDEDTRVLLARALGELGATVDVASSAAEARLGVARQRPDAIVSDIGMPDEDGLALVRSLKSDPAHRDIPAIALTAYASERDRAEALEAGCYEHVSKPVSPYHLARVIVASLRRPS